MDEDVELLIRSMPSLAPPPLTLLLFSLSVPPRTSPHVFNTALQFPQLRVEARVQLLHASRLQRSHGIQTFRALPFGVTLPFHSYTLPSPSPPPTSPSQSYSPASSACFPPSLAAAAICLPSECRGTGPGRAATRARYAPNASAAREAFPFLAPFSLPEKRFVFLLFSCPHPPLRPLRCSSSTTSTTS